MKTTTLKYINIVTGILFLLLGAAHYFIAVPMGIEATKTIPATHAAPLTMGNIVTAISVFMCGLISLYAITGIKKKERWAWVLSTGSGLYMSMVGIGYISVGPENPFAYAAFIIALIELIPSALSYKLFRNS